MRFSYNDFLEPDPPETLPARPRTWGSRTRELPGLLAQVVGEPMAMRGRWGSGDEVRVYGPADAIRRRRRLFDDRPLALAATRLSVHPTLSDYGPSGLTLEAYACDVEDWAEEIRQRFQNGLIGQRGHLCARILPSSWSWLRAWSPGLVAVGVAADYPGFFNKG